MANLRELLGNEPLQDTVDFDHLPEEKGAYPPPPIPGDYAFALNPLKDENFGKVDAGASGYGTRAKVQFKGDAPLTIVQSPANLHNGEPFETTITNVPRKRGRGDDAPVASDWDYLNKALKLTSRPKTNLEYCDTLKAASQARPQFAGTLEWSWGCNDTRDAYFADDNGGSAPVPDPNNPGSNLKGCGAKFYQGTANKAADVEGKKAGAIAKEAGLDGAPAAYPLRVTCTNCGATVRAFANLQRIREIAPAK